jgi:hypothetical protein
VPQRCGTYGLSLHPSKTKRVPFGPPALTATDQNGSGAGRPGPCKLLGLTHYGGRCLRGYGVSKRKTAADRFRRAVRRIDAWCRDHRHLAIGAQPPPRHDKLRGHDAYDGGTGTAGA